MIKEKKESVSVQFEKRMRELETTINAKRDKRNRRSDRVNAVILFGYTVLAILAAVAGAWGLVFNMLAFSLWLGLVWWFEHQLSSAYHAIDMLIGMNNLEHDAIKKVVQGGE